MVSCNASKGGGGSIEEVNVAEMVITAEEGADCKGGGSWVAKQGGWRGTRRHGGRTAIEEGDCREETRGGGRKRGDGRMRCNGGDGEDHTFTLTSKDGRSREEPSGEAAVLSVNGSLWKSDLHEGVRGM